MLLLATLNWRRLDTPVQYLGALWEFEGTDALNQAVMTLPDDIAHGIAEDIPSVTEADTVRERVRRAALDAWLEAEFGSAALVSEETPSVQLLH